MLSAPSGSGWSAPEYRGQANHVLTTEIVDALDLPVIANGDVRSVDDAQAVLAQTGAAGG